MFSLIGYVERAGSGADTITKGWKENNWSKPQIREIYDPDRVEMVLSLHGLEGNMGKDETTQKTREIILNALEKSPDLTNKELADICGISIDGIKYQIKQMRTLGLIRRVWPDKGGHWEVIK